MLFCRTVWSKADRFASLSYLYCETFFLQGCEKLFPVVLKVTYLRLIPGNEVDTTSIAKPERKCLEGSEFKDSFHEFLSHRLQQKGKGCHTDNIPMNPGSHVALSYVAQLQNATKGMSIPNHHIMIMPTQSFHHACYLL